MGALTHWVCFLFFFKSTANVLAPRLSVVFPRLVCLGSVPACCRQANVTPIPNGPPYSSVANYRPIPITSVLSKVLERLVSVRLGRFMERSGVHPTTQVLIGKVWVPVMHFCVCRIHCKVHWRVGTRLGSYRLISAQPVIRVNHQGILYKLCSVCIGGSVLSISNRSQHVMVERLKE